MNFQPTMTRSSRRTGTPALRATVMAIAALGAGAALAQTVPSITARPTLDAWLQTGNANDAYWVHDNRWGQGSIPNGSFSQGVGVSNTVGANGEVAFRTNWNWPQGSTEVKGYPSILSGRKPGYATTNNLVDGLPIRLTDGSILPAGHGGATPGSTFPMQLPLSNVKAKASFQHNSTPTGQGQLAYDIWLQSNPKQDAGFGASSITHEIMIPLANWGGYGAHNTPGGRNPTWFDHTATIDGRTWHIYTTKGSDGCLRYNFGGLNGAYGKTGWKMIAFVPDQYPIRGEIDMAALINYLSTRTDRCGERWALGNEYMVSAELGVEPVVGTGDITVYDYKFGTGTGSSAPAPSPAPSPAPAPAPTPAPSPAPATSTGTSAYSTSKLYTTGNTVTYNGVTYVARGVNFSNIVPTDTRYWSVSTTAPAPAPAPTPAPAPAPTPAPSPAPTPAPAPAPTASSCPAWNTTTRYLGGQQVMRNGQAYTATALSNSAWNVNSPPEWTPTYWSKSSCATGTTTAPAPAPAPVASCTSTAWVMGRQYAAGAIVTYNGATYYAKYANPGYNPTISTYYWAPRAAC